MRIQYGIQSFHAREVRHLYGRFPFHIWLADPLSEGWYDHDWSELPEMPFLERHKLKPGAKVFNLGAHQCIVALMLAKMVGPGGLVIALEPNAHNAFVGQRNRDLNQAEQLCILNAAVAEKSGKLIFNQSLNGQVEDGTGEWGRLEIPAFSIDDLANRYGVPDVLYIDVEGYEFQALCGAKNTLSHYPDCFVEVHVGCGLEKFGGSVETLLLFFPKSDYDLWIYSETHPEISPLTPDTPLPTERFFLIAASRPRGEIR